MQARTAGRKHRSIRYAKWGYLFIAPFFIAFAVFQLIPLASTVYYLSLIHISEPTRPY